MTGSITNLHSFVPLQGIPEQHLAYLKDHVKTRFLFKGASLPPMQLGLDTNIYLYSGEVAIKHVDGAHTEIVQATENLLPLAYQHFGVVEITAQTDAELIIIPLAELRKQLCWSQMAEFQRVQIAGDPTRDEDAEWINFILDSNLFFKVPPTNVSEIFSKLTPKVVSKGDVIVRQDEVGNACYFIKEGSARVDITNREGLTQCVAEIGPGRCFGEDALVNQARRNATVTMVDNGVLMRLSKEDFLPLLKKDSATTIDAEYLLTKIGRDAKCIIVDVRTAPEYKHGHLHGAINIPLDIMPLHYPRLDNTLEYIFVSDSGFRSNAAAVAMARLGFNVASLEAGLHAFFAAAEVDDNVTTLLTQKNFWYQGGYVVSDQSLGATNSLS